MTNANVWRQRRIPHATTTTVYDNDDTLFLLTVEQAYGLTSICGVVDAWHDTIMSDDDSNNKMWHVYQETDGHGTGSGFLYSYDNVQQQEGASLASGDKGLRSYSVLEVLGTVIVAIVVAVALVYALQGSKAFQERC